MNGLCDQKGCAALFFAHTSSFSPSREGAAAMEGSTARGERGPSEAARSESTEPSAPLPALRSAVRPLLLFFPPGLLACPAVGRLASEYCAEHGAELRVGDFICDESWLRICATFDRCGKVRPAREAVQLELEPVLHVEEN